MGAYSEAADFYDLLYRSEKDYRAEAAFLATLIRDRSPEAVTILDVACGTGEHARHLTDLGFRVDGLDIEPRFIEIARTKCPRGDFRVGDMTDFHLDRRYDVVLNLFSAIGYVRTVERLDAAVRRMSEHLGDEGLLVVDPWFEPGVLTDGWITTLTARDEATSVVRMSRTVLRGSVSVLEMEYLMGTAAGIERRSERHELGLFTEDQMRSAFTRAGLQVERLDESLRPRGTYVARAAGT